MITYLKMKRNEWKVKAIFYGAIAAVFDNQKEILELIQKMYVSLKDESADELQKEFASKLAEIIHEENQNKHN